MEQIQPTQQSQSIVLDSLKRGFGYSIISIVSLFSGYVSHAMVNPVSIPSLEEFIVLLSFYAPLFFFFFSYAILFHYGKITDKKKFSDDLKIAFIPSIIALILFAIANIKIFNLYLFIFLLIFLIVFISYGYFFIYSRMNDKYPKMRHQLVWPTILTISIPFYFGYYFINIFNMQNISGFIFLPILIILILFSISFLDKIKKNIFIFINLSVSLLAIILISLQHFTNTPIFQNDFFNYNKTMIYSLTVAGYLAVFESWWITYHVSIDELNNNKNILIPISHSFQYRMATTMGLIVSAVLIPLVFIFTSYGLLFIFIFLFHAILAYWQWSYSLTKNINKLTESNWLLLKHTYALVFLLLLMLDSLYNLQPTELWLPNFIKNFIKEFITFKVTNIWVIIGAIVFLINYINKEHRRYLKNIAIRQRLVYLFSDISIQLCTIIFYSSLIYLFLIVLLESKDIMIVSKTAYACLIYFILILISIILIIINIFNKTIYFKSIFTSLIGFCQLTRIITSLLLGMIIFLPSYFKGNSILESFWTSLPFILCLLGGFALNDVFDVEKDKINKPHRAIPSNKISYSQGVLISTTLISLSILVSFIACNTFFEIIIYLTSIIGIILYNFVLRKYPLMKNLFAAILCGLPVLFILVSFNYSIDYYLLLLSTIIFIFGRELLMDTKDIEGDKSERIFTIPYYLGERLSAKISFVVITLSNIILIYLSIINNNYTYLIIMSISLIYLIVISKLWIVLYDRQQRRIIISLWLPMLCGLSILII